MFLAILAFLLLGPILMVAEGFADNQGDSSYRAVKKQIALTFDDGPRCKFLPGLLDFLRDNNIPAAFFVQGWQVNECPRLLRRAVSEGHTIENHTYGHGSLKETVNRRGKKAAFRDIERGSQAIYDAVKRRPYFFRPPHWIISERYLAGRLVDEKNPFKTMCNEKYLARHIFKEEIICRGYLVQVLDNKTLPPDQRIIRDVNTGDYEFHGLYQKNPKKAVGALVQFAEKTIKHREASGINIHIAVFHELPVSLEALRILAPKWKSYGYAFITIYDIYGCERVGRC